MKCSFSSLSMMTGSKIMPGAAMVIREITTWAMPMAAALWEWPTSLWFLSCTEMPWMSSCCRIIGILTQFAAATAAKGTQRHTKGGALFVHMFMPTAVATAVVVAVR